MNQQEYNKKLNERKALFDSAMIMHKQNEKRKMEQDMKPFDEERKNTINNQGIAVGDIIQSEDVIIKVDYIRYESCTMYGCRDRVVFGGVRYTKKIEPRKDKERCTIRIYEGETVEKVTKGNYEYKVIL